MCPIPDNIVLHYHTVCYFFGFFVLFFVPYTNTNCGGDICYIGILGYGGRGGVGNGIE
jgi:hypothetical protein